MPYTVSIPNGLLTMNHTDFNCPICTCPHTEDDYFKRLENSKDGFIYKSCKGCKRKLGIAVDYMGDIHVWIKSKITNGN